MKKVLLFICLWICLFAEAQKDSIFIQIKEHDNNLYITQKIIYKNRSSEALEQIKLLNFVSAYQSRNTLLVKRKLEDRKTDLYYSKKDEQGKYNFNCWHLLIINIRYFNLNNFILHMNNKYFYNLIY